MTDIHPRFNINERQFGRAPASTSGAVDAHLRQPATENTTRNRATKPPSPGRPYASTIGVPCATRCTSALEPRPVRSFDADIDGRFMLPLVHILVVRWRIL
jgi:hypothetical protein